MRSWALPATFSVLSNKMKCCHEIRRQETHDGWVVAVLFIIQQQLSHSTRLHSCFIWSGMLLRCWTFCKICFSRRLRFEEGELHCNCVQKHFKRLVWPIKYGEFYVSILMGMILKWLCCILLCFLKYSRWGGPVSAEGGMASKPLSRSRIAVKLLILYVAHHKYSLLKRDKTVSINVLCERGLKDMGEEITEIKIQYENLT